MKSIQNNTIFLRHEWFKCWWEAYGARKELLVLLIKERGNLIGICPLMISEDYFRRFPIKKIGFIENDQTPRTNIISPYKQNEIIDTMITYLTEGVSSWNVIDFNKIPISLLNTLFSKTELELLFSK